MSKRKTRATYRIESRWPDGSWHTVPNWWGMQKSYAEGAFMMLRAMMGSHAYRLVRVVDAGPQDRIPGQVVDEFQQGQMRAAGSGDAMIICDLPLQQASHANLATAMPSTGEGT